MLDLTRKLCSLPGVSSREEAVREFIAQTIRPYVKWMKVDAMGNLIAFKEGKKHTGSKLLLDAHMDEVGVMVTGYTEQGCLRFAFVGGVDRRVVIGKRVYLGKERILGVFGMKPIHQTTKEERTAVPKVEELYIDIGAKDKAEAQTKVKLGEVGVFDGETLLFGDGFLKGKAIDGRAGCAAMMKLAQEELPMDVTFVFSTQEEVGTRGAFASRARGLSSPTWTAAPSTTGACSASCGNWRRPTASPGRPKSICPAAPTAAPTSAAGQASGWPVWPSPPVTCTHPPAWPLWRTWRRCCNWHGYSSGTSRRRADRYEELIGNLDPCPRRVRG